jgi:hypothetical protein
MIGRDYFSRQAMTLLKLARVSKDPHLTATLAIKAADLKDREDTLPVEQPSGLMQISPAKE